MCWNPCWYQSAPQPSQPWCVSRFHSWWLVACRFRKICDLDLHLLHLLSSNSLFVLYPSLLPWRRMWQKTARHSLWFFCFRRQFRSSPPHLSILSFPSGPPSCSISRVLLMVSDAACISPVVLYLSLVGPRAPQSPAGQPSSVRSLPCRWPAQLKCPDHTWQSCCSLCPLASGRYLQSYLSVCRCSMVRHPLADI